MEHYGMRFEEMNKGQKVKHIWEYYRYHILAVIIATVFIGLLGKSILFPEPADDVDVMFVGQMYIDDTSQQVSKQFKEEFKTGIDFVNVNWENDAEISSVMFQKIPLLVTANELDIMGIATGSFERFAQIYGEDMFMPLEEVPELATLLEKNKDKLYVCNQTVDNQGNLIDAKEHVYGIKADTFSRIPCLVSSEEMVIGLNPKAKDFDKAVSMLKYILE